MTDHKPPKPLTGFDIFMGVAFVLPWVLSLPWLCAMYLLNRIRGCRPEDCKGPLDEWRQFYEWGSK